MNKEFTVLNKIKKKAGRVAPIIGEPLENYIHIPAVPQQPQIVHKLKRMFSEIGYAERNSAKFCSLTAREKQIIRLIVSGFNNPQISEELFISRRTVEQHRKNINRKIGMHSLPEICAFAYAFNLV